MNKRLNIILGIILSFLTLFVSLIIHVFYTPFLLKSVGDVQYGVFSYALSITSWISILSSALTASYIKYISVIENKEGQCGSSKFNGLFISLFLLIDIFIIIIFSSVFALLKLDIISIGNFATEEKELFHLLFLVSGIELIISIPLNIFSLYISFKSKFIYLKIVALLIAFLPYVISIPFLISGKGVVSFLLVHSIVLIVSFVANVIYSIAILKMKFSFKFKSLIDSGTLKSIISFTFAMLFVEIVDKFNATSDKIILGSMVSAESVTIYQLGLSFSEFLTTLSLAISTVFIPTINSLVINKQKEKTNELFIDVSFVQMCLLFFVVGGFFACGKEFVILWVGKEKIACFWVAFSLLFIGIVPLSQNIANEVQKASNLYSFRIKINFISILINVGISISLIFILGKDNAIMACLIGTLSTSFISKWIILSIYNDRKIKLPMKKYWLNMLKFAIVAIISCGVAFLSVFLFTSFVTAKPLFLFLVGGVTFCLSYIPISLFYFKKEFAKIVSYFKQIFIKKLKYGGEQ